MDILFHQLIQKGNLLAPEWISLIALLFALVSIFIFHKYAGLAGLYVYNCLVVCIANVEILHLTQYHFWQTPIPLGTVLFTTTFLTNDIITNHYGKMAANRSVFLSFSAYIFFTVSMLLSLAHLPATHGKDIEYLHYSNQNYEALIQIFVPSLRILIASLVSFFVSQQFNIGFFHSLKFLPERFLWIRQSSAMFLASIVDHLTFSFIAFYFFITPKPSLNILIDGYIIGSYMIRILVIIVCAIGTYLYQKISTKKGDVF